MPPNNLMNHPPTAIGHKSGKGTLIISLAVVTLLFLSTLVFAIWAYGGMQDNKLNVDKKVNAAVAVAQQQTSLNKDKQFAEELKNPNKTYNGPDTFGSINFKYPKTWSGLATVDDKGSIPIDAYFHPGVVPGLESGTAFALRVQVLSDSYDSVLGQLANGAAEGTIKVAPYRAAKVKSVLGSIVTGAINDGQKDTMVILPLRDKTIQIYTESDQYIKDFNKIMSTFSFSP